MAKINILDSRTIDKIAAGEVVERPSSVVKELVENAMDSGADAITVEIKEGGISFIRVTDNGSGIEKSQAANAFLRHATSKISTAEDLGTLTSLGFRGEALASIAAVSLVELVTKTREELTGLRYVIEGGVEKESEEIGAPEGTTVMVRNLFYNTPPRRKFLKQPQTEGSYVEDLMEHLAMSNPKISFKFVVNGQNKFYTTGSNDLHEIIYRIYGKEIAAELADFSYREKGMSITGYLGKPVINRANRNFEIFFINGRYIKSSLIAKAVEEGYKEYLMQHKFPFCVLHFQIDTDQLDVNVHPTKMEVRIADGPVFYEKVRESIYSALHELEMIPKVVLVEEAKEKPYARVSVPEPFESRRIASMPETEAGQETGKPVRSQADGSESDSVRKTHGPELDNTNEAYVLHDSAGYMTDVIENNAQQLELFDDKLLSAKARESYEILGQFFETYWIAAYQDRLLIIDQHAAHEKVKYERLMKHFQEHDIVSQTINPPMIVTLSGRERDVYQRHAKDFEELGFMIEEFGGSDYAIRGVPMDLYGYTRKAFFQEILDELAGEAANGTPESIRSRIASMACKAAVKGNMRISRREAEELIDELLTLENPYHCPHGRPTIISMSRYEIEKKFKRIVS